MKACMNTCINIFVFISFAIAKCLVIDVGFCVVGTRGLHE